MIIFRSVFRELIHPFGMTLLVMVGLLMMEKIYRLLNLVVDKRLNLNEVGLMLVYLLPQVLSVTFPLAVVGAVFVTVIRQSMDSEVISLRASGRSLFNYALPFLTFGFLISWIALFNSVWLQPVAYRKYRDLQVEMVRWRAEEKLIPGVLNYDFGDKVIRIGGRKSNTELTDVFISNKKMGATSSVITANSGWIEVDPNTRQVVFRLSPGQIYSTDPDPELFRTVQFENLNYVLDYKPATTIKVKEVRLIPTGELLETVRKNKDNRHIQATLGRELHTRLTLPWACLSFSLAALPMALVDPRSGKRAGYLRAISLVAGFYIVWAGFKDLVFGGKTPPETLWLPSILIFLYGILRLWQINADIHSIWRVIRR